MFISGKQADANHGCAHNHSRRQSWDAHIIDRFGDSKIVVKEPEWCSQWLKSMDPTVKIISTKH